MKLKSMLFGIGGTGKPWPDFGLLLIRLGAGVSLAVAHGFGKLPVSDRFVDGVGNLGFPMPVVFAWAAALSEAVFALMVAAGLLTRPAALFAAFTMGVAFFLAHGDDPFADKELPFLFMVSFVAILFTGPGRYSVDALIGGKKR